MKLFPDKVLLGRVAVARLVVVERSPGTVVGRFTLEPEDEDEYLEKMGDLQAHLGYRYQPIMGTWVSFEVPPDRDEIDLLVGLDATFGRQMMANVRRLKLSRQVLISGSSIRSLALGYFSRCGLGD